MTTTLAAREAAPARSERKVVINHRPEFVIFGCDIAALVLSVGISGLAANALRLASGHEMRALSDQKYIDHILLSAVIGIGVLLWFVARRHYVARHTFSSQMKDVILACLGALLAASFVGFATKSDLSRLYVGFTWIGFGISLVAFRLAAKAYLTRIGSWFMPVLLVGDTSREENFLKIAQSHPNLGMRIASKIDCAGLHGLLCDNNGDQQHDALVDLLRATKSDRILLAPRPSEYQMSMELVTILQRARVPFVFAPETGDFPVDNVVRQTISPFDGVLMSAHDSIDRPFQRGVKAIVEFSCALISIILLGPLMLMIAILITKDGGPVFYRHRRIGKNGLLFDCLKFRTMAVDSHEKLQTLLREDSVAKAEWDANQKLNDDPRVTKIGKFLRSYSLDELPQLLNVLKGDMSIVGPRPVVPEEIGRYGEDQSYYLRVRPGLTGLWQVNGRNNTTYHERVRLDGFYVRNWTLWRDFCIACKTLPEVLWRRSGL